MKDPSEKLEILVVDDEAEGREALAELLSNEGYTVVCAENGRQALDCLSGMTPALGALGPCSGRNWQRACARCRSECCGP